jgi:hypothetical protein
VNGVSVPKSVDMEQAVCSFGGTMASRRHLGVAAASERNWAGCPFAISIQPIFRVTSRVLVAAARGFLMMAYAPI